MVRASLFGRGDHVQVLLVEDNPADAFLIQEGFREVDSRVRIDICEDGEQALDYLWQRGSYRSARRPHLIVLDLNLPRVDGREVLGEIKSTPGLRTIPVLILSSSDAQHDIDLAYDLQANCYLTKPTDLYQFMGLVRQIEEYWLTFVSRVK